jgi:hypothetical protein
MLSLALFQAADSLADANSSLRLMDSPALWIVALVVLPLFALITWIGYSKESISRRMRVLLASLRMGAFLVLLLVLARPVRVEKREEVHPAEVIVLLDDSASMRRKDTYAGDPEMRKALAQMAGAEPTEMTRLELAQAAFTKSLQPMLAKNEYEARLFSFSENAAPLTGVDSLSGRGSGTHLGSALTQMLSTHRGRNVTDIIVLSDGRSNGGIDLGNAAQSASAAGIPVHTLVVGDTRPEKNAIVELVEAPTDALEGDELAVTVRVRARGADDLGAVQTVLEEIDTRGNPMRVMAEEQVELSEDGDRVVLVAPALEAGLRSGERRFRISVAPLEGETMIDDNTVEFSVHVSAARMRVLYIEGYPRWEFRFLKEILRRSDSNIEFQCFLLTASPDFPQESSAGLPSLLSLPTSRQALLDNYDVIIMGDVNPYAISADPSEVEEFFASVREFVKAGGGILFQAGESFNPRQYQTTPLNDLLPVVVNNSDTLSFEGDSAQEFKPRLSNAAELHEVVRLHPDRETNRMLWEDSVGGLRGFFWYSPVAKAKPGTNTLLEHPTDISTQSGKPYPLLVLGHYPQGRTMFMAFDSTWRWRFEFGNRYHEPFWRNAIRWLSLGRLKSGDRRFRLESSRTTYDLTDRITLEARVLDEDFLPSQDLSQKILWAGPDNREHELDLGLSPDRAGLYHGVLQVDTPGLYRVWMMAGGQRVSATEFDVILPSRENNDPSPDPLAMETLSERTKGKALDLAQVAKLVDELPGDEERHQPVSSRLQDAWDTWTTLIVALSLLALEWILRKRVELV